MIDTLKHRNALLKAGFDEPQADGLVHALAEALEQDAPVTRTVLTAEVANLEARLEVLVERRLNTLLLWIVSTALVSVGLGLGGLYFILPHFKP